MVIGRLRGQKLGTSDNPSRRRTWLIALALIILILLPPILLGGRQALQYYNRYRAARFQKHLRLCQWKLKANLNFRLWYLYGQDDGTILFPPDLKSAFLESEKNLVPGSPSNAIFLYCPGSGTKPGLLSDADEWQDYIYIDWSRYYGAEKVPDDYPLIYDRRLSNHDGKGINVVTVGGEVYWDPDAGKLCSFALWHPEYEVPLPE